MRLVAHADVAAFLGAADGLLATDEARHNLIYGICSTLQDTPEAYPVAHFWTVADGGTLAAVLRTSPFNFAIARPASDEALVFAAERLRAEGVEAPGVVGSLPEADVFARAWTSEPRLRMSQGIYAAREVHVPAVREGALRLATLDDLERIVEWARAFEQEALTEDAPHVDVAAGIERRIRRKTSGFGLWEVDGAVVSMCGFGGLTPHGIRIGPVYTPPELRGRGYGSAVTAHVSKQQLDGDRDFCFLYTDLANPTSNKIYVDIGYEFVCESADYAF